MSELIDRERLKEVLKRNFGEIGGADVLRQLIDVQPTVDSAVHGHWIFKDSTGGGFTEPVDTYICSKCGKESKMSCSYISKDHFCKNCGAKMDEDMEENHERD